MKITRLSITRPTLVVVVMTLLVGLGLFTYGTLNYELLPKITSPVLSVSTAYPGASPGEVENTVTKKLEDALSSLEGVKKMSSTSMESFSSDHRGTGERCRCGPRLAGRTAEGERDPRRACPMMRRRHRSGKFDISAMPIMNLGVAGSSGAHGAL
jgi:hypothetical protein